MKQIVSSPRKRGSSLNKFCFWIPAFAGITPLRNFFPLLSIFFFLLHSEGFSYELLFPNKVIHLAFAEKIAASNSWEEEFEDAAQKKNPDKKSPDKQPSETGKKNQPDDNLTEKIYETQSRLAVPEKSVYLASILSLFVGFGLGNFYAEDPFPGYIAMITELVGVAVLAAGIGTYYYEEDTNLSDNVIAPSEGLMIGGGVLFIGMRLYSTINAGFAAHAYNKRNRIKTLGVNPYYRRYNGSDSMGLAFNF